MRRNDRPGRVQTAGEILNLMLGAARKVHSRSGIASQAAMPVRGKKKCGGSSGRNITERY
jgi:hypothetical protein